MNTVQKALKEYEQRQQAAAQQSASGVPQSTIPGVQAALEQYYSRHAVDPERYQTITNTRNRVSSFIKDADSFLNAYNRDFPGGKRNFNAADYLAERQQQADELKRRRAELSGYLEDIRDSYSYADYLDLRDYLDAFDSDVDGIMAEYGIASNAKSGMRAYEDEILAEMERNERFANAVGRSWNVPFGMTDSMNPIQSLADMVNRNLADVNYYQIGDQWTDEQRYRLGILQMENPEEARKYARDVNRGEDPFVAYAEQQKAEEALRNLDIAAAERELAGLEAELEEWRWGQGAERFNANDPASRRAWGEKLEEHEKRISDKKREINQARHIQEGDAYAAIVGNPDFTEKSGYVSTAHDFPFMYGDYQIDYKDPVYEYINNTDGVRESVGMRQKALANKGYDLMTEEEVGIYNYLYATEGKEKAQAYLNNIQESLNERKGAEIFEQVNESTARELLFGVGAGLNQFGEGLINLFNTEDNYIAPSQYQFASGMVREDLGESGRKLPEFMGGGTLSQVGFDLINTTANMAPSIITSIGLGMFNPALGKVAGSALMGASAAGSAYQEALNLGYSKEQARAYSALVGGSEVGLEYLLGGISSLGGVIPDGVLSNILSGVDNALARVAIDLGGSMASEGFEEGLQEVLTPWFKNLTLMADEDVNWNEVAYSTLLGALSALPMEIPGAVRDAWKGSISKNIKTSASDAEEGRVPDAVFSVVPAAEDTDDIMAMTNPVAEDGRARRISTNESVDVLDFASLEKGNGEIQLQDGSTADVNDIAWADEDQAWRFMTVKSLPGIETEAANDLIHTMTDMKTGGDIDTVVGVRDAYGLGYYGAEQSAINNSGRDSAKIPEGLRLAAYQAGQKQRAADAAARPTLAGKGTAPSGNYKKVVLEGKIQEKNLSKKQKGEVAFMDYIAENFSGTTVHVYRSYRGKDGKYYYRDSQGNRKAAPNGKYVGDEIWVDLNAGDRGQGLVLNTFAHEMYHHVEKWNKEKANELAQFVVRELGLDSVEAAVSAQMDKAEKAGLGVEHWMDEGLSREQAENTVYDHAMSDFVADSLETMFTRGDPAKAIANLKQENRGLFDEIRAFVDKWVSKLRSFYKDQSISMEGEMVAQLERFEELQKLFMEAVQGAGENFAAAEIGAEKNTTPESDVKYSNRDIVQADITNQYKKTVDQVLNMQNTKPDHVVIGYTPKIYEELGMPSLPFVIGTGHIYSAAKTEAEAKQDSNYHSQVHYHGLGADVVKDIYEKLQEPVMIIASKDVRKKQTPMRSTHSVVAIVDVGNAQKSLLLPIEITAERTVDGIRMDVNALSSVYDRNVENLVKEAIALENTGEVGIYYAKKEALTLPGAGVRFPVLLQQSIASNSIIHRFPEKVNMNISDATQSQQFKRWFGDWQNAPRNASKVVNTDGSPKVMYHGSPAQFSRFDRKKAKSSGLYGRGFYFTDSDTHAKTYGNTYSVYLNIRNPLQSGGTAVTRQQVRSFLEAVAENEDYSIENYGTYDVDTILNTVMGKSGKADAFKVIQDINVTAIGDMVEAAELFNSINGTTFDGIVVPTETVAFYPEQIKSATDNIGTFDGQNDDIYHSLRNTPDDMTIMEREFVRLAGKYEKLDSKAGMDEKKLAQLKADLRAEAGKHKEDSKLWDKEFNRLLKLYEANGRKVTKLEEKLRQQKASSKAALEAMKERQAKQMEASLREQRAIREELTGQKSNYAIMEREFIRIAREFEKLESKAGKQGAKDAQIIRDLRAALNAEAKAHKSESEIWQREFARLLREYETSGRRIAVLEQTIQRQRASAKAKVQSRRNTEMRHKIQRKVGELNRLLTSPTKHRNVPEYLQTAVADILEAINMEVRDGEQRRKTYEATLLRYDQRIAAETDPARVSELIDKRNEYASKGDQFASKMDKLKKAYEEIRKGNDSDIEIDTGLGEHLDALFEKVGDTPLGQMNAEQLAAVNDVLNITMATVRNANEMLAEERSRGIQESSHTIMREVRSIGGGPKKKLAVQKLIENFGWLNLKPVQAMEIIGSEALTKLYNNVRKGEDTLAVDLTEARDFFRNQWSKHKGKSWDLDKQYTFTSTSGKKFRLTVDQIMSLYALSKREQSRDHLRVGGFSFDSRYKSKEDVKIGPLKFQIGMENTDASAYNLSDEILGEIIGKLSPEQRAFVDEMQGYLSDTMAAKGNEVSLKKYGIRLFKEKNYFPLRVADQYMAKKREQQTGDRKLNNAGFTQAVTPNAKNPVVLSSFMETWAEHVDEMSLYHSFVLPLDDLNRVLNYHDQFTEEGAAGSVVEAIRNAYGEGATKYLDQLIRDVNGGARADSVASILNKGMSMAKKAQTMASLSVAIQQPSAIMRAGAMIDPKYFIGPKVTEKMADSTWEEIKKYAPIARIKEMGGFDTNVGKSTVEYLTDTTNYEGFWEKFGAAFTDSKYRDELLGRLPAKMDELSWGVIWNAVKREQEAAHPAMNPRSDAFMKLVAERFTDVISQTQVYDSVFSRSGMMRSKDTGVKMATSFMAEPTTTANMLAVALVKAKRGGKESRAQLVRTVGALTAALIANSALVAIVYAMRDDDDEKRYGEKWLESFREQFIEGLNPLTYVPVLRDFVSMSKGFDIERTDMALYGDLINAVNGLKDQDRTVWEKIETLTGATGNLLGIPVKNLLRDGKGLFKTIRGFVEGQEAATGTGWYLAATGQNLSDGEQMLTAIRRGDEAHIQRVFGRFDSQKKAESALQSAIRAEYVAGKITAEEATQLLTENFDREDENEVYWLLREWDYAKENGSSYGYGKFDDLYKAIESGEGLTEEIQRYRENGTEDSTIKSHISKTYRQAYLADGADREAIADKVRPAYLALGYQDSDVDKILKDWDFEAEYGMSYADMKNEYREGTVDNRQIRGAMEFYGLKRYEIEATLRDLDKEIRFKDRYGMSLSEMLDSYDEGDVTRNSIIGALEFNGKTNKEARETITQRDIRNRLGIEYSELDNAYQNGDISYNTFRNAMLENGATAQEADEAIAGYDWLKNNARNDPELTISDAKKFAVSMGSNAEDSTLEDYGISVSTYKEYKVKKAECQGVDANGDGKTDSGTLRDSIFRMIDSMAISDEQKDALALLSYSMKSIRKYAPWH